MDESVIKALRALWKMRVVCKTVPPIQEVMIQGAVGGRRKIMMFFSVISRLWGK
jgi:hypothetical protein